MIQRVGRINRLDTPFKEIYTYNFFPTDEANDVIKLKEAAIAKINYFIEMLGNDAKLLTDGEEIKSFELFSKLTSREFITGEEEEESSELKFLKVIEKIRDDEPELFAEIKDLPRKIRVARKVPKKFEQDADKLLTYLRKGNLDKYYLADKTESKEIDFITAAAMFEAKSTTKSQKLPGDFYDYLTKNKTKMKIDLEISNDDVSDAPKGGKNISVRVLKILNSKEFKRFKSFTEIEEDFLRKVKKALSDGVVPKTTLQSIHKEIKGRTDPKKIISIIQRIIPKQILEPSTVVNRIIEEKQKEVILSEFFTK
jgi:hypothetical protein